MKYRKVRKRILAGLLALCMLGNEAAVYAVENIDAVEQDFSAVEEELTGQQDVSDNTVLAEQDLSDNAIAVESDESNTEGEAEETLHCSVSGTISDITNRTATFTAETVVEGWQQDDGHPYLRVDYFFDEEIPVESKSEWLLSTDTLNFALSDLVADADYTIKATIFSDSTCKTILAESEELYFHTLPNENETNSKSEIDYTFTFEGDTIGKNKVHFALLSGYDESKEYTVTIYLSDNTRSRMFWDSLVLNNENDYTYESTTDIVKEMDVEYSVWAEVIQNTDGETTNILMTDKITRKIEQTKVFELSVVEDSITYATAKVNVNWINKEIFAGEEINLYIHCDEQHMVNEQYMVSTTLIKGQKEQETFLLYDLCPGRTYELIITVHGTSNLIEIERNSFSTKGYEPEPITEIKYPSQEDIARKWKELDLNYRLEDSYEREVNHTDGGLLSRETLQNALDYVNLCRYVAGVPADVIYDEEISSLCNALAELYRLNGGFSTSRPEGITDEFYQRSCLLSGGVLGSYGTSSGTVMAALATRMIADTGMGFRRDILNPELSVVGFGQSANYSTMYINEHYISLSSGHRREGSFDTGYYHWPAKNAPLELDFTGFMKLEGEELFRSLDTPTLYLSDEYDDMIPENITVQVVSKALEKSWTLTSDMTFGSDEPYLLVDIHRLQFDTNEPFPKGDEVTVTVTGTTINGEPAPITYTMNFFSIEDIDVPDIPAESVSVAENPTEVMEGRSAQFYAKLIPENATNKKVSWSVESADGIGQADITPEGILTGKLEGTVKVTATCESDSTISDSILVKIIPLTVPLESIHFSKTDLRMEKGSSYYLPAILTPANATDNEITYSSSAPEKVTVVNGLIKALETTEEPVIIKATVGELSAECSIEVYAKEEYVPDKNYDTRITGIVETGESEIYVGETNLIKYYPVTNGQELLKTEYEMTITCDEKYLTLTPVTAEDHGCWYKIKGTKAGKQKISITVKSKVKGNENPESVTKNFTYIVEEKAGEEAEETSTAPILVNNNIAINQNTVDGTALDIRLIEGNTTVKRVYLTSKKNDGTERLFAITPKSGTYYIQTKEIGANKKYNLIVHIETDQGAWEYPLKVTTKKSFPAVTIKQTVKPNTTLLYENAVFRVISKEAIESVTFTTTSSDFVQVGVEGSGAEYLLTIGQKEHGSKLDKKGTVEIAFAGYRSVYSKKITVSTTSQKVKTNTLTSNTKKVTVNSENGEEIAATLQMGLQNSAEKYPAKIIISSTNSKTAKMLSSKSLHFTYNKNTGVLKVFVKEGTNQGTYKYKITGCILENGAFVATEGSIPLTVTVAAKEPTFTLKASGSIDLIAREQSCVTYTPSIKNIAGCVKTAELEGEDADKFYLRVEETGKIKVYARAYAALFPKTTYILNIKATLDNGYACKPVQVKIKPKQSAFKASAKQSTITLCRSEIKAQPIEIVVKNPLSARIAHVKAVSIPQGMTYDSESQTLQITNNKKVKSGKIYKATFEVTPAGAHKSIKPAKITIKVKVK